MKGRIIVIGLDEPFKSLADKYRIDIVESFDKIESLDDIEMVYIDLSLLSVEECRKTIINIRRLCGFRNISVIAVGNAASEFILRESIYAGASSSIILPISKEDLMENIEKNAQPVGKRVPLDVKLINPFIAGTKEVFNVMAGIPIKRKSLFLKKDYKMFGEVSGIMGLTGDAVGSVVINFPKKLANRLISSILGLEEGEINDDDMRDGVGEILNMVAGKAKTLLANTKYHFKLSIPTVVVGHGYEISHPKDTPCIVVIFVALETQFAMQVSLAPQKNGE